METTASTPSTARIVAAARRSPGPVAWPRLALRIAAMVAPMARSTPGSTSVPGTKSNTLAGSPSPKAVQKTGHRDHDGEHDRDRLRHRARSPHEVRPQQPQEHREDEEGESSVSSPKMSEAMIKMSGPAAAMRNPSVARVVPRGSATVSAAVGAAGAVLVSSMSTACGPTPVETRGGATRPVVVPAPPPGEAAVSA